MEEQFKQAFVEIELLKKRVSELEFGIKRLQEKPSLFERRETALAEIKHRYERQNANMPTIASFGYDEINGEAIFRTS